MPRKRRRAKVRRLGFKDLWLTDLMHLAWGWTPPLEGSLGKLQTLEDCRGAWEQNRERFMIMCVCEVGGRRAINCDAHTFGYKPGERPWGWWKFEAKRDRPYRRISRDTPEAQFPILKKMGVISKEEEKLFMQHREARRREQEEHEAYLDSLSKRPEIKNEQPESPRPI